MTEKTTDTYITNQNFLSSKVDMEFIEGLPFRLQKRVILEKVGLPLDHERKPFKINDGEEVLKEFDQDVSKKKPFLIVISENPIKSVVPPLCWVKSGSDITWRDGSDQTSKINRKGLAKRLKELGPESWVEFADELWGENTIAGKLVYISENKQRLELQKNTTPAGILRSKDSATFSIETKLDADFPMSISDYKEAKLSLQKSGFDNILTLDEVRSVFESISNYLRGVSMLNDISPMPTLEFAFTNSHKIIFIDVDWPDEYKYNFSLNFTKIKAMNISK